MDRQQRRLTVLCCVAAQRRVGWPPHSTYNVCRAPNPSMMSPRKQDLAWANASPVPSPPAPCPWPCPVFLYDT